MQVRRGRLRLPYPFSRWSNNLVITLLLDSLAAAALCIPLKGRIRWMRKPALPNLPLKKDLRRWKRLLSWAGARRRELLPHSG